MCTDDQGFTTVVGPRWSVESFIEVFPSTDVAEQHHINEVQLIDLVGLSHEFSDSASPAIAVIEHEQGHAFSIAAELQAQFLVGHPQRPFAVPPPLLFEPGYDFGAASPSPGPTVAIDQNGLNRLLSSVPSIPVTELAVGPRVAVLDTGDQNASNDMVDFMPRPPHAVKSVDDNGHGTAVSEVISTLAPTADIYPLRVLGPVAKTGPSYRVLAGLAYALWSGQFDIVNASLTSVTSSPCEHSLGTSVSYIVRTCSKGRPGSLPLLVAAAGNQATKDAGYPAVVPKAIVALALEEQPLASGTFVPATYNSLPPQGATSWQAFGGSSSDPVGKVTSGTTSAPLWGTSLAAAAVTASHLP